LGESGIGSAAVLYNRRHFPAVATRVIDRGCLLMVGMWTTTESVVGNGRTQQYIRPSMSEPKAAPPTGKAQRRQAAFGGRRAAKVRFGCGRKPTNLSSRMLLPPKTHILMADETTKLNSLLSTLNSSLRELEAHLEPLFAQPLPELVPKLHTIQQAKLHVVLPYLIYDLLFSAFEPSRSTLVLTRFSSVYLKSRGIDPKTHPVVSELVCHTTHDRSSKPTSFHLRTEYDSTLKKSPTLKAQPKARTPFPFLKGNSLIWFNHRATRDRQSRRKPVHQECHCPSENRPSFSRTRPSSGWAKHRRPCPYQGHQQDARTRQV
jgi:hypothetical protein